MPRALSESLITPLELKMEEWKKVAGQLDKDHAKGMPAGHVHRHMHMFTLCFLVLVYQSTKRPEQTSRKSLQTPSNCRRR